MIGPEYPGFNSAAC